METSIDLFDHKFRHKNRYWLFLLTLIALTFLGSNITELFNIRSLTSIEKAWLLLIIASKIFIIRIFWMASFSYLFITQDYIKVKNYWGEADITWSRIQEYKPEKDLLILNSPIVSKYALDNLLISVLLVDRQAISLSEFLRNDEHNHVEKLIKKMTGDQTLNN